MPLQFRSIERCVMNKFLKWGSAAGATVATSVAMAAGAVPAAVQTAIDDSSETGRLTLIAVVVGLAVIGLLKRGFSKAGI